MSDKAYRDTLIMSFMDGIDDAVKLMEKIDWNKVSTERIMMFDHKVAVLMLDLLDLQAGKLTKEIDLGKVSTDNAGRLMKQIDWEKVPTERITMLDHKIALVMLDLIDLQNEDEIDHSRTE